MFFQPQTRVSGAKRGNGGQNAGLGVENTGSQLFSAGRAEFLSQHTSAAARFAHRSQVIAEAEGGCELWPQSGKDEKHEACPPCPTANTHRCKDKAVNYWLPGFYVKAFPKAPCLVFALACGSSLWLPLLFLNAHILSGRLETRDLTRWAKAFGCTAGRGEF